LSRELGSMRQDMTTLRTENDRQRVDAQQATTHGRLLEERVLREQQRTAIQSSFDAMDAKVKEEIARSSNDHQRGFSVLRDVVDEHKSGLEARLNALSDKLADERRAREEHWQVLQASFETYDAKLREEAIQANEQHRTQYLALQDLVVNSKSVIDADIATISTRLAEERVVFENRFANLQTGCEDRCSATQVSLEASIKATDTGLKEEMGQQLSALQSSIVDREAELETRLHAAYENRCSATQVALEASIKATDTGLKEEMAQHLSALQSSIADREAELEARLRAAYENRCSATQMSLEASIQAMDTRLKEEMVQQHSALQASIADHGAELEARLHRACEDRCSATQVTLQGSIEAMDTGLKEDMAQHHSALQVSIADHEVQLEARFNAIKDNFADERKTREEHLKGLQTYLEALDAKLSGEAMQANEKHRMQHSALQDLVVKNKLGIDADLSTISSRFAEERGVLEDRLGNLRAAYEDRCGATQATLQASIETSCTKLREESQLALEDRLGNLRAAYEDRCSATQTSLEAYIEASCTKLREESQLALTSLETRSKDDVLRLSNDNQAAYSALRDLIGRMSYHDALRDLSKEMESKLHSEIDAVLMEQQASHSMLQGQIAEHSSGLEVCQATFRGQLAEVRVAREETGERLDKLDRRFGNLHSQEVTDRETGDAALRTLVQQLQQDVVSRNDFKAESNRLWEAVNTHTHDMGATHSHKVQFQKQTMRGMGMQTADAATAVRTVSPSPSRVKIQALEPPSTVAAVNLSGGPSNTVHVSSGPSANVVTRQGSAHLLTSPATTAPQPSSYGPGGRTVPTAQTRHPSTGPTRRPMAASTALPATSTALAQTTPRQNLSLVPAVTTATVPTIQAETANRNMMAGMVYSTEVIEKEVDEVRNVSCGPAMYMGKGS